MKFPVACLFVSTALFLSLLAGVIITKVFGLERMEFQIFHNKKVIPSNLEETSGACI